jgi:hypothetical protein
MLGVRSFTAPLAFDPRATTEGIDTSTPFRDRVIESHVTVNDLKAHLDLLAVFYNTHHAVQKDGVVVDNVTGLPVTSPAQFLFLARAQHRFDMWVSSVLRRPGRDAAAPWQLNEIPPVDVLMLLHVYMLNPWNFYEDCYRIYPELEALGPFPLSLIHSLIDAKKFEIVPTTEQKSLWESCTGTSFVMPVHTDASEMVEVKCPSCIRILTVPWINNTNTGFGQKEFSAACAHCATTVTRESLCVAKFLGDLVPAHPILAHTLLSNIGEARPSAARDLTRIMYEALGNPELGDGGKFDWKMSNIFEILKAGGGEEWQKKLGYIMSAYSQPSQTSMDLGQAVLRQARFIDEMHKIEWCGHASFEGHASNLANAIVRYHRFLALDPKSMVPPVDIDLVFHTHQLQGSAFRETSFQLLGRFLSHDDSSERAVINGGLNHSKNIWKEAYGSEYRPTVFRSDGSYSPLTSCADVCSNSPPPSPPTPPSPPPPPPDEGGGCGGGSGGGSGGDSTHGGSGAM